MRRCQSRSELVMCEAPVVAHIVERIQHRNAGLQNSFRHVRLNCMRCFQLLTYSPKRLCRGLSGSTAIPCFAQSDRAKAIVNVCNRSKPDWGSFLLMQSKTPLASRWNSSYRDRTEITSASWIGAD